MEFEFFGQAYYKDTLRYISLDDIKFLFERFNLNLYKYIDGQYVIKIRDNNFTYLITDYFGKYSFFIDDENNFYDNLPGNQKINANYLYKISLGLDTKYFAFEGIPFDTILEKFKIVKPGIYIVDKYYNTMQYIEFDYDDETILEITPEAAAELIIKNISSIINTNKFRNIIIPVSMGADTRAILAILIAGGYKFTWYTFGNEYEFVKHYLAKYIPQKMLKFEQYNSKCKNTVISTYITALNGLEDIYYRLHVLHMYSQLNNFDLFIGGEFSNELLGDFDEKDTIPLLVNGIAPHLKILYKKFKCYFPYTDIRITNTKQTKNYRNNIIKNIIRKTVPELLYIPFNNNIGAMKSLKLTRELCNSIYNYDYNFNTRLKYINQYNEIMNNHV